VAFSRQQVVLPGGQAYWTVLDESFEVAELFDGFLRWLRLVKRLSGSSWNFDDGPHGLTVTR
jgi:hypothetical protein